MISEFDIEAFNKKIQDQLDHFKKSEGFDLTDQAFEELAGSFEIRRLGKGMYETYCSLDYYIRGEWEEFWKKISFDGTGKKWDDYPSFPEYGSCDSPKQFMRKFGKEMESAPDEYFVKFSKMDKKNFGGYRWHKNGPYVGNKKLVGYEYYKDEPNVDVIWQFHVFKKIKV